MFKYGSAEMESQLLSLKLKGESRGSLLNVSCLVASPNLGARSYCSLALLPRCTGDHLSRWVMRFTTTVSRMLTMRQVAMGKSN